MRMLAVRIASTRREGVFVAIDSNLGACIDKEEGAVNLIPGHGGRIAQTWVNVRGGMRVFAVYFWPSEGWTPRNDALMENSCEARENHQAPWLIARDVRRCLSFCPKTCTIP